MGFSFMQRLFSFVLVLVAPVCVLCYMVVNFPALVQDSEFESLLIWSGLIYCQLVFLVRTTLCETPIYMIIVYLLASYLFAKLNTLFTDIDYSVLGFWLEGPFLLVLWLPIKAGYYRNLDEMALRDNELGIFSRNPLIALVQQQLGIVSIKPLGVLLVLYVIILVIGFFGGRYIYWQKLINIS